VEPALCWQSARSLRLQDSAGLFRRGGVGTGSGRIDEGKNL